ncbi:hypothetical protein F5883DRAFT_566915 [Diaporthe sp. PMI_573]|nr:hypothetical protein F5883DRAFT_566915 [Diaporthaceae sp. PMI_573]
MEEAVGTPGLASPSPPRLEYCKMRPVLQNGKQLVLRCSVPGPCPACMFPAIPKSQKKFTRPFLPACPTQQSILHAYMSMSLLVFKPYRPHPRLWTKRPSRPHSRHLKGELKARLFKNRNTSRPNRPLRMWIRAQAVCTLHLSLVLSRRT